MSFLLEKITNEAWNRFSNLHGEINLSMAKEWFEFWFTVAAEFRENLVKENLVGTIRELDKIVEDQRIITSRIKL